MPSVELTPQNLADIKAIENLKYQYLRAVDLRLWDQLEDTLTEEVSASYGKRLQFTSRAEVIAGLKEAMTSDVITEHQAHHPVISVSDNHATGSWFLQDRVIVPSSSVMIVGSAYYEDEYVRTPSGWKISKTGYERVFEAMLDLADIPSFSLLENHLSSVPST